MPSLNAVWYSDWIAWAREVETRSHCAAIFASMRERVELDRPVYPVDETAAAPTEATREPIVPSRASSSSNSRRAAWVSRLASAVPTRIVSRSSPASSSPLGLELYSSLSPCSRTKRCNHRSSSSSFCRRISAVVRMSAPPPLVVRGGRLCCVADAVSCTSSTCSTSCAARGPSGSARTGLTTWRGDSPVRRSLPWGRPRAVCGARAVHRCSNSRCASGTCARLDRALTGAALQAAHGRGLTN